MSRNNFVNSYREIASMYGHKEANKIYAIIILGVFIFIVLLFSGLYIGRLIDKNSEFILSDDSRYIVEIAGYVSDKDGYERKYYEIDLQKQNIVFRADYGDDRRNKLSSTRKTNYEELKNLIFKTMNNEENRIEPTEEEQVELVKKQVGKYFVLINYKNEKFYIKNYDDIKKMEDLL